MLSCFVRSFSCLILLLLLTSTLAQHEYYGASLLKYDRSQIVFMPYTPAQRLQVATDLENMFKIYVNIDSKNNHYGKEFKVDPRPKIRQLVQSAENMTDAEFHYYIADTFNSLRDFHTQYTMPAPHSCYALMSGLGFQLMESDEASEPVVAVSYKRDLDAFGYASGVFDILKNVKEGDILVSIDGLTFKEYVEKYKWQNGGANDYGSQRAALQSLSVISGATRRLPVSDTLNLVLKSSMEGPEFSVAIPWITIRNKECYNDMLKVWRPPKTHLRTKQFPPLKSKSLWNKVKKLSVYENLIMASDTRNVRNSVRLDGQNLGFTKRKTAEEIVKYGIFETNGFKLGVLFLESFQPETDLEKTFYIIQALLLNELSETDGLLIDLRDNPGGYMTLANVLPQLFVPEFKLGNGRAVNTQINEDIFQQFGPNNTWLEALQKSKSRYTLPVAFDDVNEMSTFGMAYTKPVGLFTNANCYSSCDLFSATMQDNAGAIVFGEDGTTGAGGANVIQHETFLTEADPSSFKSLPYFKKLTYARQEITLAWRQMVRSGKLGKLVEDVGVKSDYMIRPRFEDLSDKKASLSQFERIATLLKEHGEKSGQSNLHFSMTTGLEVTASGYDLFIVKNEMDQEIGRMPVPASQLGEKQTFSLLSSVPSTQTAKGITIFGLKDGNYCLEQADC